MIADFLWPGGMLVALILLLFSGYPVGFSLAGVGILFAVFADVPMVFLSMGVQRIYSGTLTNWLLAAIPLFIYMGLMLESSGIAERLMRSLAALAGRLPGGYAFAVAVIGVVMAASTGIIGASVVLMGMMSLPAMKKAGYDMRMATGIVAASGTLGILIPPSIMLIILGDQLRVPIGDLFMGAVYPGLLLAGMYFLYIILVAIFSPKRMPPPPQADPVPAWKAVLSLLLDLVAPMLLILSVLGTIIAGVATPTESAAIGAFGATLLAFVSGKLSFATLRRAVFETTKTTGMVSFVMIGATVFSLVFRKLGGDAMIADLFHFGDVSPYVTLAVVMALIFVLGFFLDWIEITLVVIPIVMPIVARLDFGLPASDVTLWFAIALAVNLQTSFLTPPFGYALFYLRGVDTSIPIGTIYRGILPFVAIQVIALILVVALPQIVLHLPAALR
ncbi:TRAP transporter large permease subunit [Salipiger sp. P9]|uniref:TRAP transporter large permease n=1 Tax=Salipiger pentaromativorans TaxID=2943193 RepID=UPI002158365E|nr:TRAP transporter large permease subunit [Salipiger pentaromativorans]MCR8550638.1 TRAP transporter large permease subunit [Salipiger pentaromativorans]